MGETVISDHKHNYTVIKNQNFLLFDTRFWKV